MTELYSINMITALFVLKILLLLTTAIAFTVMFFHQKETSRIENRLGIFLPMGFKKYSNMHVAYMGLLSIVFLLLLFI